jgi:hypothetical protein
MNFVNPNTIHNNSEAKIIESEITSTRANMDVLRRRLCETQKKEKTRTRIIASTICVSLGVVTYLVS